MSMYFLLTVIGEDSQIAVTFAAPVEHINAVFATPVEHINATFPNPVRPINVAFTSPVEHINATFTEVAMTTPYTTIDSSATVKDASGNLISNLTAYTLAVTYQDGTTAAPSVSNAGSGVYTATYNTKGAGTLLELWSFTDTGGDIAQDERTLVIAY